jgi:hypothetical protein
MQKLWQYFPSQPEKSYRFDDAVLWPGLKDGNRIEAAAAGDQKFCKTSTTQLQTKKGYRNSRKKKQGSHQKRSGPYPNPKSQSQLNLKSRKHDPIYRDKPNPTTT